MNLKETVVLSIVTIIAISFIVDAQILNPKKRYCFNFSWLGPKYNNESTFNNATCDDVTALAKNVPCREPLVITHDGTYPDIDYLWENHDAAVTCLLTDGEICAKYSHFFDGFVLNVTFMCTKVIEDTSDTTLTSGCVTSQKGSKEIQVCMCQSYPGARPCNSAPGGGTATTGLLAGCIALLMFSLIIVR